MENVSALREHMRIPGMGLTTVRYFSRQTRHARPRQRSRHPRPEFAHILNYDDLRHFHGQRTRSVATPKPRSQTSGVNKKKIHTQNDLWPWLDQLGDKQSFYLLEQFIPGGVFHIDSVVSEREFVFAEAHACRSPPLSTSRTRESVATPQERFRTNPTTQRRCSPPTAR